MDDASAEEERVMEDHFAYLQRLLRDGKILLAGPSLDPPFGVIVLVAETQDEASGLVRADPSVRAGVQTPELHPFRASLFAGTKP
jgi:uncharacterized protein YciI